jgi:hypothetical protein
MKRLGGQVYREIEQSAEIYFPITPPSLRSAEMILLSVQRSSIFLPEHITYETLAGSATNADKPVHSFAGLTIKLFISDYHYIFKSIALSFPGCEVRILIGINS